MLFFCLSNRCTLTFCLQCTYREKVNRNARLEVVFPLLTGVEHRVRRNTFCDRGRVRPHGQRRHHRRPQQAGIQGNLSQAAGLPLNLRFPFHRYGSENNILFTIQIPPTFCRGKYPIKSLTCMCGRRRCRDTNQMSLKAQSHWREIQLIQYVLPITTRLTQATMMCTLEANSNTLVWARL